MVKTLSQQQKQAFLKKRWYFQGFNGTPGLLSFPSLGNVHTGWDVLGYGYRTIIEFYEGDKAYYLYDWDDLEENLHVILENVKKDQKYLQWMLATDKKLRLVHEKLMDELDRRKIETFSFEEAIEEYQRFGKSCTLAIAVGLILECFTYPTEELIRNTIIDELAKKGKRDAGEEALKVLTAADHPSFIGKHHLDMMRIALLHGTEQKKALVEYQKKMFWMNNAYAGTHVLDVAHFAHEVEEIQKKYVDVAQELRKQEAYFATIKEKKAALLQKFSFSDELKRLLAINDVMGIIHDDRKHMITKSNHYVDLFLRKIGEGRGIPLDYMRYVAASEATIDGMKKITLELLRERKRKSVFIYTHDGGFFVLTSAEADAFVEDITREHSHEEVDVLHGNCASQGFASGKVKVCRGLEEVHKLQEGDILVACMTQPEFVPAMKKAAAIVTDEGGLTCHAAIISRELGKPCIISTKKATRVLKDGMIVEV